MTRAGYGWTDPGRSPRTFKAIANDLHALLRPPPVVVEAPASTAELAGLCVG